LTFTAEGTQTLTATVTPTDTTDSIEWSSNDINVATVENGVVTAVGNSSTVITATCGGQSATCAVNVSGIVEVNDFDSATWTMGYTGDNGAKSTALNIHESSLMPIRYNPARTYYMQIASPTSNVYARVSYFDADGKHLGHDRGRGFVATLNGTPNPDVNTTRINILQNVENAAYIAISANTDNKENVVYGWE
jgi:hypothetical protein